MDVKVVFRKALCFFRKERLHLADRKFRRLLHDRAELTGHMNLAAALREHGLNVENLSADRGPSKPGHNAGCTVLAHRAVRQRMAVHELSQVLLCDRERLLVAHKAHRSAAAKLVEAAF